jgi:hypothetical protein
MFVKPAPNLKIRDPDRLDLIPDTGRQVPDHHDYWIRRVRDGDVVVCEPPPEEPAPAEAPATPAPSLVELPAVDPSVAAENTSTDDATALKNTRGR